MEGPAASIASVALACLAVAATWLLWSFFRHFWWVPMSILAKLRKQGIPGYPFVPVFGQVPDLVKSRNEREQSPELAAKTVLPGLFCSASTEKYGPIWTFSLGPHPRVVITDPSLVRQAYVTFNANFEKNKVVRGLTLLGEGLATANGALWARQRRLISPAFSHREIKRMYPTMVRCADEAVSKWEVTVPATGVLVDMSVELGKLTLEIISRCAFGMHHQEQLGPLSSAFTEYLPSAINSATLSAVFPFAQYLPLEMNQKARKCEGIIRRSMMRIIGDRISQHRQKKGANQNGFVAAKLAQQSGSDGTCNDPSDSILESSLNGIDRKGEANEGVASGADRRPATGSEIDDHTNLLDLMLNATDGLGEETEHGEMEGPRANSSRRSVSGSGTMLMSEEQLMHECLTFLGAGHETTSNFLTWTMLLLSQHPGWQERAREEVVALCGAKAPQFEQLSQMKVLGWILNESLRLYPPAPILTRACTADTVLSDALMVPKGCDIVLPIAHIHRDKALWGPDADVFRPERFKDGVTKAANTPSAFLPFSIGPRVCIGQSFALVEAKAILAMLLMRFSWSLAPTYVHHPDLYITLKPKFGLPLNMTPRHLGR